MEDPTSVYRELSKRQDLPPSGRKQSRRREKPAPERKKHPTAEDWVSDLGQDWYDRGAALGFEFPFDANWFSLRLHERISTEKHFRDRPQDQVIRWVRKMIERWWEEYVNEEVNATNARNFFLEIDWEDLREYSRNCLIGSYLKSHGKPINPKDFETEEQAHEHHDRLTQIRVNGLIDILTEDDEPPPRLDSDQRERLRSWKPRGDRSGT